MQNRGIDWSVTTDIYNDGDTIEYHVVAVPNSVGDDDWYQ